MEGYDFRLKLDQVRHYSRGLRLPGDGVWILLLLSVYITRGRGLSTSTVSAIHQISLVDYRCGGLP